MHVFSTLKARLRFIVTDGSEKWMPELQSRMISSHIFLGQIFVLAGRSAYQHGDSQQGRAAFARAREIYEEAVKIAEESFSEEPLWVKSDLADLLKSIERAIAETPQAKCAFP
jgi:hypothetical protein